MTFSDRLFAAMCAAKPADRRLNKAEWLTVAQKAYEAEKKTVRKASVTADADSVYAAYPRREGGTAALHAITLAIAKDGLETVLAKTKEYADAVSRWPRLYRYSTEGRDLVPMATTWFNQRRYMDDSTQWHRSGGKPAPKVVLSLPEPQGWREIMTEYVNRDRPWAGLPVSDQESIIRVMQTGAAFAGTPQEVDEEMRLRDA